MKFIKKRGCDCIVLTKDVEVLTETKVVEINLTSEDTKIGDIIYTHTDYWYEIQLNPDINCQTIIGYDVDEETKISFEGTFWNSNFGKAILMLIKLLMKC